MNKNFRTQSYEVSLIGLGPEVSPEIVFHKPNNLMFGVISTACITCFGPGIIILIE